MNLIFLFIIKRPEYSFKMNSALAMYCIIELTRQYSFIIYNPCYSRTGGVNYNSNMRSYLDLATTHREIPSFYLYMQVALDTSLNTKNEYPLPGWDYEVYKIRMERNPEHAKEYTE